MSHSIRRMLALTVMLLAGCKGTAIEHGEALFQDPAVTGSDYNPYACSTCHEAVAGDADDAILPGVPLAGAVNRPHFWGGQELELLNAVNHCLYYFMFRNEPWTAQEVEARAIYAYLESLSTDASADPPPFTVAYEVYDVPAGDAGRGEGLYQRACQSCHGPANTGEARLVEWAPILPEQFLEDHPEAEYTAEERRLVMIEKVRHGSFIGYGGQMPPFSYEKLTDEELGDLLAYLGIVVP